jgi:ribosomal protein L39E
MAARLMTVMKLRLLLTTRSQNRMIITWVWVSTRRKRRHAFLMPIGLPPVS